MKLSDVVTGELSWRRLTVLVEYLPHNGTAVRHALEDENYAWGLQEHLLAAVVDQLRAANWQRAGNKGPRPQPVPRPGISSHSEQTRVVGKTAGRTPEEVHAYLKQFSAPGERDN